MKYLVLTAAQQDLLGNRADLIEAANTDSLLAPVKCVDCDQYVPMGWVVYALAVCAKNASHPTHRGHRMQGDLQVHVTDLAVNALTSEV